MGIRKCDVFATAMTLLIALSKEVHEAVGLYEDYRFRDGRRY